MYILSTRRQGVECDKSRCVHSVYLQRFTASCNRFSVTANMRDAYQRHCTRTFYCCLCSYCRRCCCCRCRSRFGMLCCSAPMRYCVSSHTAMWRTQKDASPISDILAFACVSTEHCTVWCVRERLCRLIGKNFVRSYLYMCDVDHDLCSMKFDYLSLPFSVALRNAFPLFAVRTLLLAFALGAVYGVHCSATVNTHKIVINNI